jgi:ketosteroid isomerase-like protein
MTQPGTLEPSDPTVEISALEDQLTLASRHIDLAALDRLYADDIMFTGVAGQICSKAALLDEARRGLAEREKVPDAAAPSYEKDDLKVVVHGDTAVASYRFVVTFRHGGQDLVRRFRTTNVWMKRSAGWQVVAAQTASINGANGAAGL